MFKWLSKANSYIHVGMACVMWVWLVAFGSAWFWNKPVDTTHDSATKEWITKTQEAEVSEFFKSEIKEIWKVRWENYEVDGDCFLSKLDHNNDGLVNGEDLQYLYDNVRIKWWKCGEWKLCTYRWPKETCTDEYTTNDARNFYIFLRGWSSKDTIQQQATHCGDVECVEECVEPDVDILLDLDDNWVSSMVDAYLVVWALNCDNEEDKETCFSNYLENANRDSDVVWSLNDGDNDWILDHEDDDWDNDGIVNREDSDYTYAVTCGDWRCDLSCDWEVDILDVVLLSQYVNGHLTEEEIIERFVESECIELCEEESTCGNLITEIMNWEQCDEWDQNWTHWSFCDSECQYATGWVIWNVKEIFTK